VSGSGGNGGDVYPFNRNEMRSDAPSEEDLRKMYGVEAFDQPTGPAFRVTDWGMDRYDGVAPPIDWLIEGVLPKATPGLLASIGGIGKSYLLLDLCVRVAAGPGSGIGKQIALGGEILKQGRAVMLTWEESHSAVHRRLDQILNPVEKEKLQDHLFVVPIPDTGRPVVFMKTVHGEYQMTALWTEVCSQITELKPDLIVLDPLQALVQSDINADPAAAQCWWTAVSQLTAQTGACLLVAHHLRKDNNIDGPMSARAAIRGTSALVDGARWVYALWVASEDDRHTVSEAMDYPVGLLEMVHGAVVKSNDISMTDQRTYLRDPETGLLNDRTEELVEEIADAQKISEEQKTAIFNEVSRRWEIENPFSGHPNAGDRYLGRYMMRQYRITRVAARDHIRQWMDDGFLVKQYHSTARKPGLRVG